MFPTGKIEGQNPTCTAVFGHLSGVILIHSSPLGWNLQLFTLARARLYNLTRASGDTILNAEARHTFVQLTTFPYNFIFCDNASFGHDDTISSYEGVFRVEAATQDRAIDSHSQNSNVPDQRTAHH